MQSNKEYFDQPYYFFLKEKENKILLYYNFSTTISEARKDDLILEFLKSDRHKIKKKINSILKNKNHKSKNSLKKDLTNFKDKIETNELIDSDGSWSTSRIPILDPRVISKWTTDQTVPAARISNDPVTRGYRVYYGESKINEVDYSDAFGYEETKNMDGKKTFNYLQKHLGMDPIEAAERTKQFGKDYTGQRKNKSKYKDDKNFIDRMTLSEIQRSEMIKLVEDIVSSKKEQKKVSEEKEKNITKFLKKNLQSLKKIAEKEGISINQLISYLKTNE